jgi:hypothetical protein
MTGDHVELAYVDQGYTGEAAAEAAEQYGIELVVVNTPGRNEASSCCRGAGWWREVLPGQHDSGVWPVTTNGWLPLLPLFISLPVPASCSPPCSKCSLQVNNRL